MITNKGGSQITVLKAIPYFIPKTLFTRTDVYFNGDKSGDRMGGSYRIRIIIMDAVMREQFMSFNFHHLVVDDETSYCLPFVDPGKNWFVYAILGSNIFYTFILAYNV